MRLVSIVLFALGLALVAGTAGAPRYQPDNWNAALLDLPPGVGAEQAFARYAAEQAAARTQASRLQDLGRGVAALGGALLLVLWVAVARTWRSVRQWRSARDARTIVAAAVGSWLSLVGAELWWLAYSARRGDYPPWADSMGIPVFGLLLLAAASLPLIGLLLFVGLRQASLPVAAMDLRPSPRFWLASLGGIVIAFLLLAHLVQSVRDGAFLSVAAAVFALASLCAWWPAAAAPRGITKLAADSRG